ncbi:hypothetical protein Q5425_03075 [Amycolatopsis sp. A133]|uniref:hypothetical protein n=1 Tax=Amycolatopsis sp. A133 TaxID=3064472 RepID=UPI0027FF911F|nr:hypothetical protein [Amycolatopsis sp. A133]MDQ7802697.1 hypothetical protein [Amycolatopsis sp. A133]
MATITLEEFVIIRRTALAVPVALAALSLAACSSSGGSPTATDSAGVVAPAENSSTPKTAADVTKTLGAKIATLKPIKTYAAEDDPNHLLGRPNGYSSKTAFGDSRVKADDVEYLKEDAVERGGSVEVFTTEEAAQARMDFIQTVAKGLPAVGEYDYVKGGVLVRVSRFLTPDQAKDYQAALGG